MHSSGKPIRRLIPGIIWTLAGRYFCATLAKAAFKAHLSRLPSVSNGLGLIEQTTLETIRAGVEHPYPLFREVGDKLHILGMGDLEYWAHLKRMTEGPHALLQMSGATTFPNFSSMMKNSVTESCR